MKYAQRIILYRAKAVIDGKWLEGLPRYNLAGGGQITAIMTLDGDVYDIVPDTLGEYTGLNDKHGLPIFEGDVVKIDGKYIRLVVYSGEHTAFCAVLNIDKPQAELLDTLGDGYDNYKRKYEIVGNIYDNPELVEVPF